jgi:hypothetical protein
VELGKGHHSERLKGLLPNIRQKLINTLAYHATELLRSLTIWRKLRMSPSNFCFIFDTLVILFSLVQCLQVKQKPFKVEHFAVPTFLKFA